MEKTDILTPAFIFDFNKIKTNINKINDALKSFPISQLYYSVKSNSLPALLNYLINNSVNLECVSDEEYEYLKTFNINFSKVILNGPVKSKKLLKEAIKNDSYINIDSIYEAEEIIALKKEIDFANYNKFGLRININFGNNKMYELIGHEESRFGIPLEDISKVITLFNKNDIKITGLHFHINHNYELERNYQKITNYIIEILTKYKVDINHIDLGGGILRAVENVDYKNIIKELTDKLSSNNIDFKNICFMVEPGAALVGNTAEIITKVISKKEINNKMFIIVDASRSYYDATYKFNDWKHYSIDFNKKNKIVDKQIICGYTCMENDRLFEINNANEIDIDSYIKITKTGTYSINFIPFFIKGYPNIYIIEENKKVPKLVYKNYTIMEFWKHEQNN